MDSDNQFTDKPMMSAEPGGFVYAPATNALRTTRLPVMLEASRTHLKDASISINLSESEQEELLKAYSAALTNAYQDPYVQDIVKKLPDEVTKLDMQQSSANIQEHLLRGAEKALQSMQQAYDENYVKDKEALDNARTDWKKEDQKFKAELTKFKEYAKQAQSQPDGVSDLAKELRGKVTEFKSKEKELSLEKNKLDAKGNELANNNIKLQDQKQLVTLWRQAVDYQKSNLLLLDNSQTKAPATRQNAFPNIVSASKANLQQPTQLQDFLELGNSTLRPEIDKNAGRQRLEKNLTDSLSMFSDNWQERRTVSTLKGIDSLAESLKRFTGEGNNAEISQERGELPKAPETPAQQPDIAKNSKLIVNAKGKDGVPLASYQLRAVDKLNEEYSKLTDTEAKRAYKENYQKRLVELTAAEKKAEQNLKVESSTPEPSAQFKTEWKKQESNYGLAQDRRLLLEVHKDYWPQKDKTTIQNYLDKPEVQQRLSAAKEAFQAKMKSGGKSMGGNVPGG
jgi:hypothetical protein